MTENTPWKRLRGVAALSVQRAGAPLRRRVPFGLLRRGHRLLRRATPRHWTSADPFSVVVVDPSRITHSILETAPKHPQWGRTVGGRWDVDTAPFADRPVAVAVRQHVDEGVPWAETELRTAFRRQLDRFGTAWGHTSMDGFETRCRTVRRLYESIRDDGYRRQEELPGGVPVLDEINVDIGRNGELLWRGYGQHRLAIAKALHLDAVPVFVHRRHREWERKRRRGAVAATHPDAGHRSRCS